jgi:hypothetical protein
VEEFLRFEKMITPIIIQIIFWIGSVLCVAAGLVLILGGIGSGGGAGTVLGGLLLVFLGPLAVRIKCEILIVLFSINDSLKQIKNKVPDLNNLPDMIA